jgi:hypothetical protein
MSHYIGQPKPPNGSTFPSTATILIVNITQLAIAKTLYTPKPLKYDKLHDLSGETKMAMSRNIRNRKAKGVARHETLPIKIK